MNLSKSYRLRQWSTSPAVSMLLAIILLMLVAPDACGQSAVRHNQRHHPASPTDTIPAALPGSNAASVPLPDSNAASAALPDSIAVGSPVLPGSEVVEDAFSIGPQGRMEITPVDTVGILTAGEAYATDSIRNSERNDRVIKKLSDIPEEEWVPRAVEFNPDPTRAVWLSALFPGLGQIYNRRYWKLPLVVGGYLGLAYGTSWNNEMLKDYTRAYADLLDKDPSTNSYMDFFAPNVKETDLDKSWLQGLLRSRKNYFRRNRDLCIISMVAVYLVAMVDAYVDASLSHFDISPNLSMDVAPALIQDGRNKYPSMGLCWALNF